jgi:AcrR family transcriptional regulator
MESTRVTPVRVTSRQAKADDTRRDLLSAAASLFVKQGYHLTSVEQIARQAGVAKGTFFLHFPTKGAVVTAMVQIQMDHVRREHDRLAAEGAPPLARLRATVMALGKLSNLNLARAVLIAGLDNADVGAEIDLRYHGALDLMIEDARAAVRSRDLARGTDPEALALVFMNSFLGAAVSYATNPRGRTLAAMLESMLDMSLPAFAPGKSKKGGAS